MRMCIPTLAVLMVALTLAPVRADDKKTNSELSGSWDQNKSDGFIRFFPDGTFRWYSPAKEGMEGRYRVLPGALELNVYPGGVRQTVELKYILETDSLRLLIANRWFHYTKAK